MTRAIIKGLVATVVALVMAAGALVWVRYEPALSQPAPVAIVPIQPAWGTTGFNTAAAATPAGNASAASANIAPETKAKTSRKSKTQARSGRSSQPGGPASNTARAATSPVTQQARLPSGN